MNNFKWYKFLITEGEEIKIDPESVVKSQEEKEKFIDVWKTSRHFRERLFNDIIKLEIDNVFKSLPRDKQIEIYKIIKPSYGPNQGLGQHGYVSDIAEEFQINFSTRTATRNLDSTVLYYLLKKYFKGSTEDQFRQEFQFAKNVPEEWINTYHLLYSNFENHTPSIPKISYVPKPEMNANKKHNLDMLNAYSWSIPEDTVKEKTILDEVKIKDHIGSGYYGIVFSTEDGRAIKFFQNSVDMRQDLKRMKKVSADLFSGAGTIEDMPYFDYGRVGKTNLFYAIMPEIVPLTKAPFYDQSEIFGAAANVNKGITRELKHIFKSAPSYKKYKDLFLARLKQNSFIGYDFDIDYNQYAETIDKIAQAGYRAYKKFKGSDLHSGNIGYLRQKPDTFFYFDM